MPNNKFCTRCGASLQPDLTGTDAIASPQPARPSQSLSRTKPFNIKSTTSLIAIAGVVVITLLVIFIGYPLITTSPSHPSAGTPATSLSTLATANGSTQGGSYVIIETEEPTPLPTTEPLLVVTTLIPTTLITPGKTMSQVTKAVFCPSDRFACNNTCIDLLTNSSNCGSCGNTCSAGNYCLNGNCVVTCSAEQMSCPDGCFNLMTNPRHCGSCGNSCQIGLICYNGRCDSPATPMIVPK